VSWWYEEHREQRLKRALPEVIEQYDYVLIDATRFIVTYHQRLGGGELGHDPHACELRAGKA